MVRLAVFVAGATAGAIATLVAQNPKKVADKLREAAAFVVKKVRDAYPSSEPEAEGPVDGPNPRAA